MKHQKQVRTYGGGIRPVDEAHRRLLDLFGIPRDDAPRPPRAGRKQLARPEQHEKGTLTFRQIMPTCSAMASPEVKKFLRQIGSKGGRKSAQHPNRKRLNKAAAESRWRKRMPQPKDIIPK